VELTENKLKILVKSGQGTCDAAVGQGAGPDAPRMLSQPLLVCGVGVQASPLSISSWTKLSTLPALPTFIMTLYQQQ